MSDEVRQYKFPLQQNSKSQTKMSIKPIIVPRSHDGDVWQFPGHVRSGINSKNMKYDITEEYDPITQTENYNDFDSRIQKYTNFSLDTIGEFCTNQYNESANQNNGDSGNCVEPSLSSNDWNYGQQKNSPSSVTISSVPTGTVLPTSLIKEPFRMNMSMPPRTALQKIFNKEKEGFYSPNTLSQNTNCSNPLNPYTRGACTPLQTVAQNITSPYINPPQTQSFPMVSANQDMLNRQALYPNSVNVPPSDLLIPQTVSSIYGRGAVTNEERIKYLQTIEPSSYTYSDVAYPVNANLGISYTPDIPPLSVTDQIIDGNGKIQPIFHRIDPQLVRDGGVPSGRLGELPRRNAWSSRFSGFDAQPSINFEDVYDPRFNGYGDGQRSYEDTTSGNIQYYYSDIDVYREPVFGGPRTKVDHVLFVDPFGRELPEYHRKVGMQDVRNEIELQWLADSTYHRESIMEANMRKVNERSWQSRYMPLSKASNTSSFTSRY